MNRTKLLSTLGITSKALANSNLIPILTCFCFKQGTVTANNEEIAIVGKCDNDLEFAVNGRMLMGLLEASSADEIMVTISDNDDVTIKAGRSTFKLPYFPVEDFIFAEPEGKWSGATAINDRFLEGLSLCLKSASSDITQPALCGVTISKNGVLYGCDGDTLTAVQLPNEFGLKDTLIPSAFCDAVLKINDTGKLRFSDEWVKAEFDLYTVYGRLVKLDKPIDFEGLIKKTIPAKSQTDKPIPDGFKEALAQARVLADPESAKTVISVESGRLKLLTETPAGVARDSLVFKDHPDVQASVSAQAVHKAVAICDQMVIHSNCCVFTTDTKGVMILISNME